MAFVAAFVAARGDGVGKNEKFGCGAAFCVQAVVLQVVLVVEHCLQTRAADVTIGRSVNRIAHDHVVSGHRFRNGSGRAADAKEPARHFLSGADFGEGSVFGWVQVYLERLLVRIHHAIHGRNDEGPP